jgi:PKD repeat protein
MDSEQTRLRAPRNARLAAIAVALIAAVAHAPAVAAAKQPGRRAYARLHSACALPRPSHAGCLALVRTPVPATEANEPGVTPFTLRAGAASAGPAGGLTPADLAGAYGYDPSGAASGQTIGIVDAFDDPNIESDLGKFDSQYGLRACTEANKCFKKVGQTGSTSLLPSADTTGWSAEIALDVEAAHSACPNCSILLVEAENTLFSNLGAAVQRAVSMGATVVSNSYGGPEGSPSSTEEADYNHPGVVIAAATGDLGYDGWVERKEGHVPPQRPDLPAALSSVLAVGGTTLELTEGGQREDETVWNGNEEFGQFPFVEGASGGGCSTLFAAPPWQQNVAGFALTGCGAKRMVGDVAAVADPRTGFDIYDSYDCGAKCEEFRDGASWLTIGGTSLATPLISGMYALAGGADGVTYPAAALYGHLGDSSTFDVTEGGNGICDAEGFSCGANAAFGFRMDCEGTTACNAAPGFDGPTGVGAPASLALFKSLEPTGAISPPGDVIVHQPAGFSGTATDPNPGGNAPGFGTYAWNWGDGTESSGEKPTHTFAVPGEYTVTMAYTDRYGLKAAPVSAKVAVTERTAKEIEEEAAARKKAEEAAAAKKKAEEAAAAKKKAEEEAAAKKKAEEEVAAKKKAEQEAEALGRKAAEEVAAQAKAAEEAARKAAESHAASGQGGVAGFKSSADPNAALAGLSLQAGASGTFTLKISCPAGESSCEGKVTVQTSAALTAATRARVLTLASASFKVAGGKFVVVKLHLSARARALLARRRRLRVRVTIAAHDPAGASHTTVATATLRRHR